MLANINALETLQAAHGHTTTRTPVAVFNVSDESYAKAQQMLQEILNILKRPEWMGGLLPAQRAGLQEIQSKTDALMKGLKKWQDEDRGQSNPTTPINPG